MRYSKNCTALCATMLFSMLPAIAVAQTWSIKTIMGYGLRTPIGVAVDAAGTMVVGDGYEARALHRYTLDASGNYVTQPNVAEGFDFEYVALDAGGTIYATERSAVHRYKRNGSGVYTRLSDVANTGLTDVEGVAIDTAGRVYVADGATHATHIYAPNASGGYTQQADLAPGNSDAENSGVAVDIAGNVYVSDSFWRVIHKYAPDGSGAYTRFADVASGGSFGSLAVDKTGHVYATDNESDTIHHYAPNSSGGYMQQPAITAGLLSPYGIAVDAHGAVYICDTNHARIRKAVSETIFASDFESRAPF